jgi:hypothetical protein
LLIRYLKIILRNYSSDP